MHWTRAGFSGLAGYRRFLAALYRAHAELGLPAARRLDDEELMQHEETRLDDLRQDLATPLAVPKTAAWPPLERDFAWGVSYALTGSAIGAGVILRSGTIPAEWPKRYLAAESAFAKSGGVRRFFDGLNAAAPEPIRSRAGAEAVFRLMAAA